MTNPTGALRMLITYAIVIPVAILVGYLLTNPLDYGTLGFLGVLIALIVSPIFIKWYYPILVFGIVCPMTCFFIVGKPPSGQVVVIIALLIATTERILTGEKRSVSTPVMVWPLLFIVALTYMTAELTGGIGLHSLGGATGGGKKYLSIFLGIAGYFALTSQAIPRDKKRFYIALVFLTGLLGFIGNLFPFLPSPLNMINLLFPPTMALDQDVVIGTTRLGSVAFAVGGINLFLLAMYGLRGTLSPQHPVRALLFVTCFLMSMLGGFRSLLFGNMLTLTLLFFMEGLHRTRLLPAIILSGVLGCTVLAAFSNHLPYTFQRSMSFLPLKWDAEVLADAEGSSEWRYNIWRATWPQVPQYLLLGKGYSISKEDYDLMGGGAFANMGASHIDSAEDALALSSDYHSGPLSTLMPFGIWGGIGILWLMGATFFVIYRNYRYGDPEIKSYNGLMLASCIGSIFGFFFIFGGFNNDVGGFATSAGFSLAFNGGLCGPQPKAAYNARIKPLAAAAPQPA